jgi:hypothetical protein
MKQALALTFLSSMTCLVAWDAEAAPQAHPHAAKADPHHPVDKKKISKAAPHHGTKADPHRADKKKVGKAEPHPGSHAKASAPVALSAPARTDAKFTLEPGAKVSSHASGKANAKAVPSGEGKAGAKDVIAEGARKPSERSYWLAADPHVPLAFVDGSEIHSVGKLEKDCGSEGRWARPKSRWHAVDAWGQVTGSLAIRTSDLHDVTGCHEVSFKGKEGKEPHVLLVSEDSAWKPSEKLAWAPDDDEKKSFDRFTATLEKLWVNDKPFGKALPLSRRAMFFQMPASADRSVKRPTRWAVVGGPILLVAYVGEHDHWKVASVQNPLGLANSYQPVGVFDMNGDKLPEIIYHSSDGPSYGESVLGFDPDTLSWADTAVSPGGGTM